MRVRDCHCTVGWSGNGYMEAGGIHASHHRYTPHILRSCFIIIITIATSCITATTPFIVAIKVACCGLLLIIRRLHLTADNVVWDVIRTASFTRLGPENKVRRNIALLKSINQLAVHQHG